VKKLLIIVLAVMLVGAVTVPVLAETIFKDVEEVGVKVEIQPGSGNLIDVSPDNIDLGKVKAGEFSDYKSITISNVANEGIMVKAKVEGSSTLRDRLFAYYGEILGAKPVHGLEISLDKGISVGLGVCLDATGNPPLGHHRGTIVLTAVLWE